MQGRYAKAYLNFFNTQVKGEGGGIFDTIYIVSAKSKLDTEDDSLKGESTRARESTLDLPHFHPTVACQGGLIFRCPFFLLVGDAFALSKHTMKPTAVTLCTL